VLRGAIFGAISAAIALGAYVRYGWHGYLIAFVAIAFTGRTIRLLVKRHASRSHPHSADSP
jgi:sugar phosphate permease